MPVYDFIVVGAGPAGCVIATRLARAFKEYNVLLIDAGGKNDEAAHQSEGERYWTLKTAPDYNWGYKSVPQDQLNGRELDCSRGKGLGGSTAIHFCVYTRGPSADYDRWAKLVNDDAWRWSNVHTRFNKIETYHEPPPAFKEYVNPSASEHGHNGPVDIGFYDAWDQGFAGFLDKACEKHEQNIDINSGNPIGIGISASTAHMGRRVTSATAYLSDIPTNLTVMTDVPVERILFEGRKAVGVETSNGKLHARHEVIISVGALDSPKLLVLSGVGPKEMLEEHGIQVVQHIPGIGKNLRDRLFTSLVCIQKPGANHRSTFLNTPEAIESAREQWMKDQSGPLSHFYLPQMIAYLKAKRIYDSDEFHNLDEETKQGLLDHTVPNYELFSHTRTPIPNLKETDCYLGFVIAFMNNQSVGEVRLRSPDPKDSPIIDQKFLSHPFDRRVAIESVRHVLEFLDDSRFAQDRIRMAAAPSGRSDEEIYNYIQKSSISMWHHCGTVQMGKPEDPTTCVDKDFRVVGLQNLRVADMSISPILPNAHTQSVAYLIGETAAEKLIAEYSH